MNEQNKYTLTNALTNTLTVGKISDEELKDMMQHGLTTGTTGTSTSYGTFDTIPQELTFQLGDEKVSFCIQELKRIKEMLKEKYPEDYI
jgi:hypothetical protein